jgi:signal transduction histidine kinase
MKKKISVSLKLSLIIILTSTFIFVSMSYFNIREQTDLFETSYSEKAEALAQSLDASIGSYNHLNDKEKILSTILSFIFHNSDILSISVNLPKEEHLEVFSSSNSDLVGAISSAENKQAYADNEIIKISSHEDDVHRLTVISPIQISGQKAGTYEIIFSLDKYYNALNMRIFNLIVIAVSFIVVLVIIFLLLLRITIIKPINIFKNVIDKIGKGNLDARIQIKSHDEFSDLAEAFNKMTQDLQERTQDVKKLLKQKDDFINQLGHDLKTPLTPITTLLPLVKKRVDDEKSKEMLDISIKNAEYMKNLVVKTLQLARLNSPTLGLELKKINLLEELKRILDNKSYIFSESNIIIENKIDDKLFVYADKIRIQKLFDNLISNSIKYIGKNDGKITFNAKIEENVAVVSVSDTGVGMAKDKIGFIFDEFYKADSSRHDIESTGLGLSICKRIIEKHGGRIWVESLGENKGTTFYFTLHIYDSSLQKNY